MFIRFKGVQYYLISFVTVNCMYNCYMHHVCLTYELCLCTLLSLLCPHNHSWMDLDSFCEINAHEAYLQCRFIWSTSHVSGSELTLMASCFLLLVRTV